MKIYLAGPLFNPLERDFNVLLKVMLESINDNIEVWLPQEKGGEYAESHGEKTTKHFFDSDVQGLNWCDVVVAVLDGVVTDPGTAWEIGFAYAQDKTIIGYKSDSRAFMLGNDNIMIKDSVNYVYDLNELKDAVQGLIEVRGNDY